MSAGTTARPKVLFVGGYGRGGSTLLDRIVGQTEGFFSAGEVRHLWREGLVEDRRCGCGERFSQCPVWQAVLEHAFPDGLDVDWLQDLRGRVDSYRRIPQIATGRPPSFRRDRDTYLDVLRRLYTAICETTGARVVIDSSKDVSHGWLLTRADVDLSVVHLVRDSRAAAFSWNRRKFNPGNGGEMQRYSWLRSAMEWNAINGLTRAQRLTGVPFTVLRYDDLVDDPATAVDRVVAMTGESARPPIEGRSVTLGTTHTVAGNPNRFVAGPVTITRDEEWRTRMPVAARFGVTALTLPGLRRYGFRGAEASRVPEVRS